MQQLRSLDAASTKQARQRSWLPSTPPCPRAFTGSMLCYPVFSCSGDCRFPRHQTARPGLRPRCQLRWAPRPMTTPIRLRVGRATNGQRQYRTPLSSTITRRRSRGSPRSPHDTGRRSVWCVDGEDHLARVARPVYLEGIEMARASEQEQRDNRGERGHWQVHPHRVGAP